jgi:uncharacterized protein (TIGR02001 family)
MMNIKNSCISATVILALASSSAAMGGDFTANVGLANNYLWRGLTQSENEAAISGGIDFATEVGFYAGTWVSNVSYLPGDAFSYEHDLYLGFRGGETFTYDIGYLYYNYDTEADYDFSEVYLALGFKGLTLKGSVLAHTGRDEELDVGVPGVGPDVDYSFGSSTYVSLDYALALPKDVTLTAHIGTHQGDFARSFNGFTSSSYEDYSLSLSKTFGDGTFKFTVSDTNLSAADQDGFGTIVNNNQSPKFVVSYTLVFDL